MSKYDALHEIVTLLSELTHDELRDLADLLQTELAETDDEYPLRNGLTPIKYIIDGGWPYREFPPLFSKPARQQLVNAFEQSVRLRKDGIRLVQHIARALQAALAPIGNRKRHDDQPIAQGSIEAKYIARWISSPDGPPERKLYGPYLYYRYWETGGDRDRRGRRQKSVYLGEQSLALLYDQTEPESEARRELEARIIAAYKAGTMDTLLMTLRSSDSSAPAVFMADYQPERNRKAYHDPLKLTPDQREVLAAYAAGRNYGADYKEGLHKRKVARGLASLDLLSEVSGLINHRKHNWRLTAYGLQVIRGDPELQAMIARLRD